MTGLLSARKTRHNTYPFCHTDEQEKSLEDAVDIEQILHYVQYYRGLNTPLVPISDSACYAAERLSEP